jgi:hypothetical protein
MEDTIVSLRFTDVDRALRALYELRGDVTRRPAREVYAEVRGADEAEKAKLP